MCLSKHKVTVRKKVKVKIHAFFNLARDVGEWSGSLLTHFNLLKPTGHVMHQQINIQQLYVLPTMYLCVLYLSEDKQRLVPLTA